MHTFGSWILALSFYALLTVPTASAHEPYLIVDGIQNTVNTEPAGADIKTVEYPEPGLMRVIDPANGWIISLPDDFGVDASLSAVKTVFSRPGTRIEVYRDDLTDNPASINDYIYYSRRFIRNTDDHTVTQEYNDRINGRPVHVMAWERRPLSRLASDLNHYWCAEITANSNEVYTLFIKSDQPIDFTDLLLSSFTITERQGRPQNHLHHAPSSTRLNEETRQFRDQYFPPASTLRWGVFEPSAPEVLSYLKDLRQKLGYPFHFIIRYQTLDERLPIYGLNNAFDDHTFVELTLQTVVSEQVDALHGGYSRRNASIVYDILDGRYDDYLIEYAAELKEFRHPVLFRLNNEMNGDWCWYSAFYTGRDAEMYVALWRYIHELFDRAGVDNVLWVWNPHDLSLPAFQWNHWLNYYPGDSYVDIVGMTGYNTGTYFPGERWRTFEEIYSPLYAEYSNLFDKPFMITEFGSNSVGGNKPAWIHTMFDIVPRYDRIKVAIWWSGVDYDQQNQPGRVYLIDENEDVVKVFQSRFKDYKP